MTSFCIGNVKINVVPSPTVDSTSTSIPNGCLTLSTKYKPIPEEVVSLRFAVEV